MSSHQPPLTCDQFKAILKKMGFAPRSQKATSHEQWVGETYGQFRKVTVDCPKAPFSQDLITAMAKQAGVTKKIIYQFHFGKRTSL
jgi:predicted RNA binding protein YcfA (HicA-like mRNA interferase family)